MRVAYIDQREETVNGRSKMVYYSVLVKGGYKLDEVLTIFILGVRLLGVKSDHLLLFPQN